MNVARSYKLGEDGFKVKYPTITTTPDCGVDEYDYIVSTLKFLGEPPIEGLLAEDLVKMDSDTGFLEILKTEKLALW